VSDDAAFSAALGVDVAGFEAGWLADLGISEPVPSARNRATRADPRLAAAPVPTANPGASGLRRRRSGLTNQAP